MSVKRWKRGNFQNVKRPFSSFSLESRTTERIRLCGTPAVSLQQLTLTIIVSRSWALAGKLGVSVWLELSTAWEIIPTLRHRVSLMLESCRGTDSTSLTQSPGTPARRMNTSPPRAWTVICIQGVFRAGRDSESEMCTTVKTVFVFSEILSF